MNRKSSLKWKTLPTKSCSLRGGCYNNFEENIAVYVVNCKIHAKRYEKFKKYSKKAGIKACRVPCVLGKKFSEKAICQMKEDNVISNRTLVDMTRVEVSINMSHFNAWQRFLNTCMDYAIIFEDDVELHDDFIENVDEILKELKENRISFSILHLWNGNWNATRSKRKKVLKTSSGLKIFQETVPYNAGAVAYIISKKYAQWLVDHSLPIKMQQDILMGHYYRRGKHLTLDMTLDKKKQCYISPILDMECGGEGGTGKTTQQHGDPYMNEYIC